MVYITGWIIFSLAHTFWKYMYMYIRGKDIKQYQQARSDSDTHSISFDKSSMRRDSEGMEDIYVQSPNS